MDIEESPIYVLEIHEDVFFIEKANVFVPPIEETCGEVTEGDCFPFSRGIRLSFQGMLGTNPNYGDLRGNLIMDKEDVCSFGFWCGSGPSSI